MTAGRFVAWTDGPFDESRRIGGLGVYGLHDGVEVAIAEHVPGLRSSWHAEALAIGRAVTEGIHRGVSSLTIYSDAESVIYHVHRCGDIGGRIRKLALLAFQSFEIFHVPGHGDSEENRIADHLARAGRKRVPPTTPLALRQRWAREVVGQFAK